MLNLIHAEFHKKPFMLNVIILNVVVLNVAAPLPVAFSADGEIVW